MQKDLFDQVPEFLAAFNNIVKNGFFEEIQFSASGKMMEGKIFGCSITATGCVPSDKKFAANGSGSIIDPNAIVAACRKLTDQNRVKDVTTKVETKDWPLWDAKGEKMIGSKGKRTELFLYIAFET